MTAPTTAAMVELRRAPASMADIAVLNAALDSLSHRVQVIQDAVPSLDLGEQGFTTEHQAKISGDGRWVNVDAVQAAKLRRQGAAVRQRRVTEWTEVES